MYTLNAVPDSIDPSLLILLEQAEPAVIGHFRHMGFMRPDIKALLPDVRVAGTAITVCAPGMDATIIHYAIGQLRPGDFLVIDRCGDNAIASFGGATAYAAKKAGAVGVVVDGLVTDLGELRQYGLPVWSRGTSAVTTKMLGLGGDFCTSVSCGGVAVNPGDAILADENGILVLPVQDIAYSANRAIQMSKDEKITLARIDQGEKYPDILGSSKIIADVVANRFK